MSPKDKHHRIPKQTMRLEKVAQSEQVIVKVSAKQHRSWHNLFGAKTPEGICEVINSQWGDPRYEFVAVKRK
jgi:hypothetical protein